MKQKMSSARISRDASLICLMLFALFAAARGQVASGGPFTLEQTVVASGGGTSTGGGIFTIEGTVGQPNAGDNSTGAPFRLKSGFWTAEPSSPTAASASISGRVVSMRGRGVRNVRITLEGGPLAVPRSTITGAFGYFKLDEIEVGQTYIMSARHKSYGFAPQTITLLDNVTDIVFQSTW